MFHKANLFGDTEIAAQVLTAPTPKEHKALGRKVKNFDSKKWDEHRERIVEEGNWNKFVNNKSGNDLRKKLLATGERELVEVSLSGGLSTRE